MATETETDQSGPEHAGWLDQCIGQRGGGQDCNICTSSCFPSQQPDRDNVSFSGIAAELAAVAECNLYRPNGTRVCGWLTDVLPYARPNSINIHDYGAVWERAEMLRDYCSSIVEGSLDTDYSVAETGTCGSDTGLGCLRATVCFPPASSAFGGCDWTVHCEMRGELLGSSTEAWIRTCAPIIPPSQRDILVSRSNQGCSYNLASSNSRIDTTRATTVCGRCADCLYESYSVDIDGLFCNDACQRALACKADCMQCTCSETGTIGERANETATMWVCRFLCWCLWGSLLVSIALLPSANPPLPASRRPPTPCADDHDHPLSCACCAAYFVHRCSASR